MNISSDNECKLNLPGFGKGNTDLIIMPSSCQCNSFIFANIHLKPVKKTKVNEKETHKESKCHKHLTGQSLAELVARTTQSEMPILQLNTDLDTNFDIIILSCVENEPCVFECNVKGEEAIEFIVYWLENICPQYVTGPEILKRVEPQADTQHLELIMKAQENIKKRHLKSAMKHCCYLSSPSIQMKIK